jgi:hypothetical protein
MNAAKQITIGSVAICALALAWPDERTDENLREVFAQRGMTLISITPATGCYRVGSYHYVAHNRSGVTERGRLCINKTLHVFELKRLPD